MNVIHLFSKNDRWIDKHLKHMIYFGNIPKGKFISLLDLDFSKIQIADIYYMWSWENNYMFGLYITKYIKNNINKKAKFIFPESGITDMSLLVLPRMQHDVMYTGSDEIKGYGNKIDLIKVKNELTNVKNKYIQADKHKKELNYLEDRIKTKGKIHIIINQHSNSTGVKDHIGFTYAEQVAQVIKSKDNNAFIAIKNHPSFTKSLYYSNILYDDDDLKHKRIKEYIQYRIKHCNLVHLSTLNKNIEYHVISTKAGVEALFLGGNVTTYGFSIYSHRGFTTDMINIPDERKQRRECSISDLAFEIMINKTSSIVNWREKLCKK